MAFQRGIANNAYRSAIAEQPTAYTGRTLCISRTLGGIALTQGNKTGVNAQFCPPLETLALPIKEPKERDLPEIWFEPATVRHRGFGALRNQKPSARQSAGHRADRSGR